VRFGKADWVRFSKADWVRFSKADWVRFSNADWVRFSKADWVRFSKADWVRYSKADLTDHQFPISVPSTHQHTDILHGAVFKHLSPELNPICYLLALLAHDFLHVSRIRVKSLTLWLLMSCV
jgi:hypothetical protein